MKKLLLLITMFFLSNYAKAFQCSTNGVIQGGDGSNFSFNVQVGPELIEGQNQIVDMSTEVECWNTDDHAGARIDYLSTRELNTSNSNGSVVFQGAVANESGSANLNGANYAMPVPAGIRLLTLQGQNVHYSVPLKVALDVTPLGGAYEIHSGDLLVKVGLAQTDNQTSTNDSYTWNIYAANDAFISLSSCLINDGEDITVDFGQVNSGLVKNSPSIYNIQKTITYSCPGNLTKRAQLQVMGANANFGDNNTLATTNPSLGINIYRGSEPVPINKGFETTIDQGSGSDILNFSVIKDPSVNDFHLIDEGEFSADVVMVLTSA